MCHRYVGKKKIKAMQQIAVETCFVTTGLAKVVFDSKKWSTQSVLRAVRDLLLNSDRRPWHLFWHRRFRAGHFIEVKPLLEKALACDSVHPNYCIEWCLYNSFSFRYLTN